MSFVSCEGNNDRFRWEMTSVDLMCTPGAEPQVTLAFSTDGVEWYRVGLDDGPDGSQPRTIARNEDGCSRWHWGETWCP